MTRCLSLQILDTDKLTVNINHHTPMAARIMGDGVSYQGPFSCGSLQLSDMKGKWVSELDLISRWALGEKQPAEMELLGPTLL